MANTEQLGRLKSSWRFDERGACAPRVHALLPLSPMHTSWPGLANGIGARSGRACGTQQRGGRAGGDAGGWWCRGGGFCVPLGWGALKRAHWPALAKPSAWRALDGGHAAAGSLGVRLGCCCTRGLATVRLAAPHTQAPPGLRCGAVWCTRPGVNCGAPLACSTRDAP